MGSFKIGECFMGVDYGFADDWAAMIVMKRTGLKEVEVVEEYLQGVHNQEEAQKFEDKKRELKKKYNATEMF